MCLLCRNPRWLLAPLLTLIVIGPFYRASLTGQEPWDEYAYLSCMDGIAFGCLAALLTARFRLAPHVLRWMMALGLSMVLWIVVFQGLAVNARMHQMGLGLTVLEIGVALILIALSQGVGDTVLTRGTGFIRLVGRSSYEVYLTHMLVVLAPIPFIVKWQPEGAMIPLLYIAMLALSIALGWVVYKAYSEPMNRLLRSRA
jgi:peptidoglycan/LPS O-acetylase OafA/YrhL